jgi:phosphoribosylamine--glycine ligase
MDHKRALDGDRGLNTGGMGTVAPNPYYTPEIAAECMEKIFLPTIRAMNAEGRPFRGCLYFGLMLTADGPKVIEYNCRFGDPEAQVVLPLLESDLYTVMRACRDGRLSETEVKFSNKSACCVIMASRGYPEKYEKGFEITADADFAGELYRGRGQNWTGTGSSPTAAGCWAWSARGPRCPGRGRGLPAGEERCIFDNAYYRNDIGARSAESRKVTGRAENGIPGLC